MHDEQNMKNEFLGFAPTMILSHFFCRVSFLCKTNRSLLYPDYFIQIQKGKINCVECITGAGMAKVPNMQNII